MTRQIHGGYYGQEREKVTAGTAHIHRGTDCGHAQHWPHNRISARQAGGVQDCPHRQCDPRFQEIF